MSGMPILTLACTPQMPELALLSEPQVCYVLLSLGARGRAGQLPVSWALVADASRSMRIPILDEQQFRELVRRGGAHEVVVDGVPVWQLSGPAPPDVRAAARSPLDHLKRALHTVVEQLESEDRFALVACAERAVLLAPGASGAERGALAQAIGRLGEADLGDRTDLARGLALALDDLRAARRAQRSERVLLLTDGFTEHPEACLALAAQAAAEHVAITTVGLGGEFQEALLTELADRSGGRALFLADPAATPQAIAAEVAASRTAAARGAALRIDPAPGVSVRRVTRIRPALAVLREGAGPAEIALGDVPAGGEVRVLVELVAPPAAGAAPLATISATCDGADPAAVDVSARFTDDPAPLDAAVRSAADRASVARLQRRAAQPGVASAESARLLRASAARLEQLGERGLAAAAREQAAAIERGGRPASIPTKELTYATRRLGDG